MKRIESTEQVNLGWECQDGQASMSLTVQEMVLESKGQQPVVPVKATKVAGGKGHSRGCPRWNAVCGESRMHGVMEGKTTRNKWC